MCCKYMEIILYLTLPSWSGGFPRFFLNSVAVVATEYLSVQDVKSENSVRNKYQTKPAGNWLNLVIYNNFHFAQTSCLQKHALEDVAVPKTIWSPQRSARISLEWYNHTKCVFLSSGRSKEKCFTHPLASVHFCEINYLGNCQWTIPL